MGWGVGIVGVVDKMRALRKTLKKLDEECENGNKHGAPFVDSFSNCRPVDVKVSAHFPAHLPGAGVQAGQVCLTRGNQRSQQPLSVTDPLRHLREEESCSSSLCRAATLKRTILCF